MISGEAANELGIELTGGVDPSIKTLSWEYSK